MSAEADEIKYSATLTVTLDGSSKTFEVSGSVPNVPGAKSIVKGALTGLDMVIIEHVNGTLN